MSAGSADAEPTFIWATRGRTWGFRFLRSGGLPDPLGIYEESFSDVGDKPEAWHRESGRVALRFPDPESRRDAAGRVIPHDFVLLGAWADGLESLEEGRRRIWHEVSAEFDGVWDLPEPPPAQQ